MLPKNCSEPKGAIMCSSATGLGPWLRMVPVKHPVRSQPQGAGRWCDTSGGRVLFFAEGIAPPALTGRSFLAKKPRQPQRGATGQAVRCVWEAAVAQLPSLIQFQQSH